MVRGEGGGGEVTEEEDEMVGRAVREVRQWESAKMIDQLPWRKGDIKAVEMEDRLQLLHSIISVNIIKS